MRVKRLEDINLVASRHIERKHSSLPVNVRRSKTSLLKFSTVCRGLASLQEIHPSICHCVLAVNLSSLTYVTLAVYFFHFTNEAFLGDRELKRWNSNNGTNNNIPALLTILFSIVIPVPLNHCFSNVSEIYHGDFEQRAVQIELPFNQSKSQWKPLGSCQYCSLRGLVGISKWRFVSWGKEASSVFQWWLINKDNIFCFRPQAVSLIALSHDFDV